MSSADVREALSDHVVMGLEVARSAAGKMRPGGTLLLMGGTGGRRIAPGLGIASAATAALPPFVAALALELAPVRINLIAAGFVDTPLSASLLGDGLEARRDAAAFDAPDRASRRTRRRRRAGGAHHGQHRAHGRDIRHRRRTAVRAVTMSDELPEPRLTRVYRLEAELGAPLDLGDVAEGHRRIVPADRRDVHRPAS